MSFLPFLAIGLSISVIMMVIIRAWLGWKLWKDWKGTILLQDLNNETQDQSKQTNSNSQKRCRPESASSDTGISQSMFRRRFREECSESPMFLDRSKLVSDESQGFLAESQC